MLFPYEGDRAGLYMRLSRDEEANKESNSITNQRKILTEFATKSGFTIVNEYIDDGFSGANFERPAFKQMMEDATAGLLDLVIVKDLSRLGRDYIGVGQYLETIFPRLRLRLISISEGFDTANSDEPSADMVPIINFFNEFHAKQTSKKTRASKKVMAEAGQFIGSKAPFGYVIDPEDKHHLLVDEEAAETVRLIFRLAGEGLGYKAIARRLRDKGVLNPTAYNNIKLPGYHKSEYWRQPHDWHPSSIKTILTNPTYLGKVVSGRRRVASFKTKEVVKMPEESWIIVEGMHEPLIETETWELAQEKLKTRKRCDNQGAIQIFAGLLRCADCGYALAYTYNNGNPRYQCSLYNVKGKGYCSSHFITYADIYQAVLLDIRRRAKAAAAMDDKLLLRLEQETSGLLVQKLRDLEKEANRAAQRLDELETITARLYEDSALGHLPPEQARRMLSKYEDERKELENRRQQTANRLQEEKDSFDKTKVYLGLIAKYQDISQLTPALLNELIDHIEVGVKEISQGEKRQKIRVVYRQTCFTDYFDDGPAWFDSPDWQQKLGQIIEEDMEEYAIAGFLV